ncbi:alpha/beta hydrolase, epoxide hydrolase-like protein [Rhodotorula toruloides]|uniref:Alpha/beta hydrolase, epoxide hydrolase-like protein n=1 Tax=Rhodotorula toruloides TaxID=5286 RepID=A0A511KQD7_RHOTO|nr:alpha/beta hydrolase, epoxide hydrolase-like protein [Rhodotorula toruloides]
MSHAPNQNLRQLKFGLTLHVEVLNPEAQQTIVFIHGLGGASTNFAAVIQAAGLANKYRVVSFDFEGHGLSPLSGNGSTSVEGYVASVAEVLDSVGADKATVVGHSLGGLIATTFAATHASRVDKLVLLGPVKKMAPGGVDALTKRAETVRSGGMSAVVDAVSTAGCSAKTNASRPLSKAAVRASLLASQPEGYAQACLALAHADDPDYSAITAPTLIIAGSEDKTSPQPTIDFLSGAIKGAKVARIEDIGHWQQVEDVDAVAREIKSFVQ